jgi:hypothetical protein
MEFASEPYLYADDTQIFKEIYKTSDCEDLQKDMHLMHAWSEKWMLKCLLSIVTPTSFSAIVSSIGFKSALRVYSCFSTFARLSALLYICLGGILTSNKVNSIIGVIRRTFEYLDLKTFRMLYVSLVRPHLEYANPVWNPYLKKHTDLTTRIQNEFFLMFSLHLGLNNLYLCPVVLRFSCS